MEQAIPRPHARKSNIQGKATAKKLTTPTKAGSHMSTTNYCNPLLDSTEYVEQVSRPAPVANMIAQPSIFEPKMSSLPAASLQATAELALDPALFADNPSSFIYEKPMTESVMGQAPSAQEAESNPNPITELPAQIDEAWGMDTSYPAIDNKVATAPFESRESYEQPASSLVSPPASSHEEVGHSPTAANATWTPSGSSSRQSSSQPKQTQQQQQQRYTPESGPMRRASSSSYGDNNMINSAERAASPTALEPPLFDQRPSHPSLSFEAVADEESLRLIKELHAQEYGLRRRGNGVM